MSPAGLNTRNEMCKPVVPNDVVGTLLKTPLQDRFSILGRDGNLTRWTCTAHSGWSSRQHGK